MRPFHSLIQSTLALIVFVGFIDLVFAFTRYHFILQLMLLLILIGLTFLGLLATHNQFRAGWLILGFVYAMILLDLLWTYFLRRLLDDQLLLLFAGAALGIVYSVASMPDAALQKNMPKVETYSDSPQRKRPRKKKR